MVTGCAMWWISGYGRLGKQIRIKKKKEWAFYSSFFFRFHSYSSLSIPPFIPSLGSKRLYRNIIVVFLLISDLVVLREFSFQFYSTYMFHDLPRNLYFSFTSNFFSFSFLKNGKRMIKRKWMLVDIGILPVLFK